MPACQGCCPRQGRAREGCSQLGSTGPRSCLGEVSANCPSASANKFRVSIGPRFRSQAMGRFASGLGWLLAARGTPSSGIAPKGTTGVQYSL